jgi:hypothetical protein
MGVIRILKVWQAPAPTAPTGLTALIRHGGMRGPPIKPTQAGCMTDTLFAIIPFTFCASAGNIVHSIKIH